jgi:hypothetical protein
MEIESQDQRRCRKPYEKPTITKLTPEEARRKLEENALTDLIPRD